MQAYPRHRVIKIDAKQTLSLFSNKALPRFDSENRPEVLKKPSYKDLTFVNLATLAQPLKDEGYVLGKDEWIALDLTGSALHIHVDERLAALFLARFSSPTWQIAQIKIQGRLLSLKRQKDPFYQWNKTKIQTADPIELLQFSLLTRSGEKCNLSIPSEKTTPPHKVKIEPTLGEDYSIIDLRIALSLSHQTANLGLHLNTGITLQTGHDFIQPIGISTDPERLTVLILRPEVINAKGEIISPLE
jgi:hypothetical protein